MKLRTNLLIGLALTACAQASVTVTFTVGKMYNSDGTTAIETNTVGILVSDTTGSGFDALLSGLNGFNLNQSIDVATAGSQVMIGNLQVLGVYSAKSPGAYLNEISNGIILTEDSGVSAAGNAVGIVWLPGIVSTSSQILAGQSYGIATGFTGSQNSSGTNQAFILPADGGTGDYNFRENVVGGELADNSLVADFTTIPEPSSTILLGLGTIGFALRRRR